MNQIEQMRAHNMEIFHDYLRLYKICERLIKACNSVDNFKATISDSEIVSTLGDLEKDLKEHFPCPF